MKIPKLDRLPTSHPRYDWSYNRIKQLKGAAAACPDEWENPAILEIAQRDQDGRGTCTGVSGAIYADWNYIKLTGDKPTADDKATLKRDVKEPDGVLHDILYKDSFSGECMYQGGRDVGGITDADGEGGELRYCVKFWRDSGMILEKDWFTAKQPDHVVLSPPNKAAAEAFAKGHKIDGWAVVDNDFDAVCQAIYEKGGVWIGIPVYNSFQSMSGGDGWYPDIFDGVAGGHAQFAYGYSKTGKTSKKGIKVYHTWDGYCNKFGGYSDVYFNHTKNQSDYFVILDSDEVKIGQDTYFSLTVTTRDAVTRLPIPAMIIVNGHALGTSPQKFAVEQGKAYQIVAELVAYKRASKLYHMTAKKRSKLSLTMNLSKKKKGSGI